MRPLIVFAVALVVWCTVAAGATADREAVVDDFAYADDAAARAAWRPMSGSADVSPAQIDGRACLRMPCNFRGTRIERASWDRSVRLDLTARRGIRFDLYVADPSPVGHFSLYFQSGGGWYATSFAPRQKGRWHTITIDKQDTKIEGRPGGWGAVETIRISAWRGKDADTEFCISNLAVAGGPADILVVRGESVVGRSPGEADSVSQYTQGMVAALAELGLGCAVVSDLDLTAARLAGKRLVILPHNPSIPGEAAKTLTRYLDGGGKLLAFYCLPGDLASAAGVRWQGHVGQKYRGYFASIRFEEGALAGAPPVVGQASWNIQNVKPADDRARVAARWFDDKGNDTGLPAVVVSQRCIFMTHVLLGDDAANKRRMLLAMAGHLVPGLWHRAAEGTLECLGRLGPYETFDDACAGIRKTAGGEGEAMEALGGAVAKRAEAAALLKKEKFAEAMDAAADAERLLIEARCLAQKPQPNEHRAFWCHSAFGPAGMEWDEAIRILAENGFTAILPNMLWGGVAFYESRVLPVAADVKEKGDQIAKCLAACRKYGVECHVWKVNWNMGWRAPRDFAERMKRDGRTQVGFGGKAEDRWLCPSHPENQRLEVESMVEVATKYDVHGVHFDYIRYPNREHCFCAGCRERFEKVIGRKIANWPRQVREDADLEQKWFDFRRAHITGVVEAVARRLRKERPKCKISAAVFRNWPADRDNVGQDWKVWCDRGLLDFVCPMDYTPHDLEFESKVEQQVKWAGKVPCYPGIGLSVWPKKSNINRLIDQIAITRKHKTGGFTIFEYRVPEV
ncbi:MAG TPA: family 10 glycosylhydrolase, partial [Phycisphaerae bacterium]|nr:family 10 glycosylhydrolase [Phycisphaerae bacterium]